MVAVFFCCGGTACDEAVAIRVCRLVLLGINACGVFSVVVIACSSGGSRVELQADGGGRVGIQVLAILLVLFKRCLRQGIFNGITGSLALSLDSIMSPHSLAACAPQGRVRLIGGRRTGMTAKQTRMTPWQSPAQRVGVGCEGEMKQASFQL